MQHIFKPYEKHHSTVKDACELAEHLKIPNLVLWHTEDKNMLHRQEKYMKEGKQYYTGTLYIPEDLDVFDKLIGEDGQLSREYTVDGIHLQENAYDVVAAIIYHLMEG